VVGVDHHRVQEAQQAARGRHVAAGRHIHEPAGWVEGRSIWPLCRCHEPGHFAPICPRPRDFAARVDDIGAAGRARASRRSRRGVACERAVVAGRTDRFLTAPRFVRWRARRVLRNGSTVRDCHRLS
jgi:hypothetical protein